MPEVMRRIATRLREFVGNRRSAPRYEARLRCSVALFDKQATHNGKRRPPVLEGHTEDISATGLSFLMPSIRIGEYYLAAEGRTLLVTLELPNDLISMKVVAVRYERQEASDRSHYLIGSRIVEMADRDRAIFTEYLRKGVRAR